MIWSSCWMHTNFRPLNNQTALVQSNNEHVRYSDGDCICTYFISLTGFLVRLQQLTQAQQTDPFCQDILDALLMNLQQFMLPVPQYFILK